MSETETKTAMPVRKHYAVWYGPHWDGIFDCPVEERDPAKYVMEPMADYFRFYDRLELNWEVGGEAIKLRSEQFSFSPFYVPGGRLLTDEEREAAFNGEWRSIASQRDEYVMCRTRYRREAPLFRAEIEFLPAPDPQAKES